MKIGSMPQSQGAEYIEERLEYFDIGQICASGQCFRMERTGRGTYLVLAGDQALEIAQEGERCRFGCSRDRFEGFWRHYLDLDTDYGQFYERVDREDQYLCAAARAGSGIRILHQDLWEMIVSFLISQQNNIGRIRKCIQNICLRYGRQCTAYDGTVYYGFPAPEKLACAGEEELRSCNLGYRAKYVRAAALRVAEHPGELEALRALPYREAKEALLDFYGIGEKVADCICLFGLHHMEAFPVDTHIRQALEAHYPEGFPHAAYQGCQGVMQQYIFYYELGGGGAKETPL